MQPGPNLRAVLMNVNEPEVRGVAFALQVRKRAPYSFCVLLRKHVRHLRSAVRWES